MEQPESTRLILDLVPHWYATRIWAEELLVRSLGLREAIDVLKPPYRGRHPIPGSNWVYFTHGIGVDVGRNRIAGGIDFDFDKPDPDVWRLHRFAEKQWNIGNLPPEYRGLIDWKEFEVAAGNLFPKG